MPQPHGGALLAGGVPGNGGGTGRPPSALRARLRGSFEERIALIEQIADGEPVVKVRVRSQDSEAQSETHVSADPADRIRALDLLAKYGLGAAHALSVEDVRDRLRATLDLIHRELPLDDARRLTEALREVWTR